MPDSERLPAAHDFLAAHHVMSLALCREGAPHGCSLMYAHKGFDLYWVSDPGTRHSQIIDGGSGVLAAATIAPDYAAFQDIRGLQIEGIAKRVEGMAERLAALALLGGRFSFLADLSAPPAAVAKAMAKAKVYSLTPSRVTFIDNTLAFGSKTIFEGEALIL
jgi:uncharacterized protein YhbP (UPF0306 family)